RDEHFDDRETVAGCAAHTRSAKCLRKSVHGFSDSGGPKSPWEWPKSSWLARVLPYVNFIPKRGKSQAVWRAANGEWGAEPLQVGGLEPGAKCEFMGRLALAVAGRAEGPGDRGRPGIGSR